MLNSIRFIALLLITSTLSFSSYAQEDDFVFISKIIKSGNAKELVKKFDSNVELNIDGEEASYSKSQAEAILKDYFGKNPPATFELNHKGESKSGLPYAIGEMVSGSKKTRVWIRLAKANGGFVVSEMSFILDD